MAASLRPVAHTSWTSCHTRTPRVHATTTSPPNTSPCAGSQRRQSKDGARRGQGPQRAGGGSCCVWWRVRRAPSWRLQAMAGAPQPRWRPRCAQAAARGQGKGRPKKRRSTVPSSPLDHLFLLLRCAPPCSGCCSCSQYKVKDMAEADFGRLELNMAEVRRVGGQSAACMPGLLLSRSPVWQWGCELRLLQRRGTVATH